MRAVAIVEFWVIAVLIVTIVILFKISSKEHKENAQLKLDLIKAKSAADYAEKLMELKEESYRNAKEKNKKLDTGSKRERIAAAGDVLCNN